MASKNVTTLILVIDAKKRITTLVGETCSSNIFAISDGQDPDMIPDSIPKCWYQDS
jgi:hypothetical protein